MGNAGTALGNRVTFSCTEGWVLNGSSSSVCQTDGWSDSVPSCMWEGKSHLGFHDHIGSKFVVVGNKDHTHNKGVYRAIVRLHKGQWPHLFESLLGWWRARGAVADPGGASFRVFFPPIQIVLVATPIF